MHTDRLNQQIAFLLELDRLKTVLRRSYINQGERRENSAEHSWHLAMLALLLAEHANEPVNVAHVIKLVLVHDIVEIDAGDTYTYDTAGLATQAEREQQAATRLFGMLPPDQGAELRALWEEFESRATPESRFARTLDTLMPQLHNYHSQGIAWQENGVTSDRVQARALSMRNGSTTLWEYSRALLDDAVARGYLAPSDDDKMTR